MTWQLASFLILAAVLLGGFAWYERSRPTSQVVALVAALAALAIASRIAFAAFPNVKPTTDIVVFAGYALGPAPGFAVGALTGLVSNFWFGQGPWTPWQMAGWGMCGVLGAILALAVRDAGRLALAATCGLAAVGYGALLNFSLMATYGGELSVQRFLALQSAAIPFDAAHAIGNVTLALLAGPAMVRALVRFRERFEWRAPALASTLLVALAMLTTLPATAQAADTDRAARWLGSVQNADGGWGASPQRDSASDMTAWAMLGLAAAGRNPLDVTRSGRSPVDFLRRNVGELRSPGDYARTVVALHAAGVNPRAFGGHDLVGALLKRRRSNGSFEGWPGTTAFAVMALRIGGAKAKTLEASISWLVKVQARDGGWGDLPGSPSTADVTGIVLQAIPGTKAAKRGLRYLRRTQRPNGGFALAGSGAVNSQSTAWGAQGMLAAGGNPSSAIDFLSERQEPDGHFRYSHSSDQTPVWVTGEALAAVAGKTYPVAAPPRSRGGSSTPAEPAGGPGGESGSVAPSSPPLGSGAPSSGQDLFESFGGATPGGGSVPPATGGSVPPATGGSGIGSIPPPGQGTAPPPSAPPATGTVPGTPSMPPFEAKENPAPKPWAPVGVGIGTGGLALGGVLLLGRRFGW